jgi:hypothetical protein
MYVPHGSAIKTTPQGIFVPSVSLTTNTNHLPKLRSTRVLFTLGTNCVLCGVRTKVVCTIWVDISHQRVKVTKQH